MLVEPDAPSGIPQHVLRIRDPFDSSRFVEQKDLSLGADTALIPDFARIKSDPHKIGDLWEKQKQLPVATVKLLFRFNFHLRPS